MTCVLYLRKRLLFVFYPNYRLMQNIEKCNLLIAKAELQK